MRQRSRDLLDRIERSVNSFQDTVDRLVARCRSSSEALAAIAVIASHEQETLREIGKNNMFAVRIQQIAGSRIVGLLLDAKADPIEVFRKLAEIESIGFPGEEFGKLIAIKQLIRNIQMEDPNAICICKGMIDSLLEESYQRRDFLMRELDEIESLLVRGET